MQSTVYHCVSCTFVQLAIHLHRCKKIKKIYPLFVGKLQADATRTEFFDDGSAIWDLPDEVSAKTAAAVEKHWKLLQDEGHLKASDEITAHLTVKETFAAVLAFQGLKLSNLNEAVTEAKLADKTSVLLEGCADKIAQIVHEESLNATAATISNGFSDVVAKTGSSKGDLLRYTEEEMTQLLIELDFGVVARKEALKEWATMRDGLEEATVEAESAFEDGNVADAILDCKRGLEIDMHDGRLSSLLDVCKAQVELTAGQEAMARAEFDAAVQHYERGLLLEPENTTLQGAIGLARREASERGTLKLGNDKREQLGTLASRASDALQ